MKQFGIIVLAVILIMSAIIFSGCSGKAALTPYEFRTVMEQRNFDVDTENPNDSISGIISALEADNDEYEIEYAQFQTKDLAATYFAKMTTDIGENTESTNNIVDKKDYYSCDDSKYFYIIAHIDDSILACRTKIKYRAEVIELFEDIGYGK